MLIEYFCARGLAALHLDWDAAKGDERTQGSSLNLGNGSLTQLEIESTAEEEHSVFPPIEAQVYRGILTGETKPHYVTSRGVLK